MAAATIPGFLDLGFPPSEETRLSPAPGATDRCGLRGSRGSKQVTTQGLREESGGLCPSPARRVVTGTGLRLALQVRGHLTSSSPHGPHPTPERGLSASQPDSALGLLIWKLRSHTGLWGSVRFSAAE